MAVVRRIQNRGYATLARVTDHLDRLSAGDESNAAIDAVDAVNLMTVHAAKGLEFPVVFIVNLGKGAGGSRAPIRFSVAGRRCAGRRRLATFDPRPTKMRLPASARRQNGCCMSP